MTCAICEAELNDLDMRLRTELRGICFVCAEQGEFFGFTLEEVIRCLAVAKAIKADENATPGQARHTKDMQS